jgi:hypothetical protein
MRNRRAIIPVTLFLAATALGPAFAADFHQQRHWA